MKRAFIRLTIKLLSTTLLMSAFGCSSGGGGTTTGNPLASEDSSASGAAAGAVGGALSSTGANGVQAFYRASSLSTTSIAQLSLQLFSQAHADDLCPTYRSTQNSLCASSGSSLWLNYSDCSFANSSVTWDGTVEISMSSGSAGCGTFPNPGANHSVYRQYVSALSSTTPSYARAISGYASSMIIDDATSNLHNFNGDTIAPIFNSGYGTKVDFNAQGARSALTLGHRIYVTGTYDHSVWGNLTVVESSSTASSRVVSGSLTVYHNAMQVIGTSVFSQVTHSDICCYPISGTIQTTFSEGSNQVPTTLGRAAVGKTETMTFTGCGTATLQTYDNISKNVVLTHCY